MNNQPLHFFTIVARNYLAFAYVLGNSIKQYHPESQFYIFLMDDLDAEYVQEIKDNGFQAVLPSEIEIDDYEAFVFKYNVTEASTAVKPFVFRVLFNNGAEKVVYLDPDIRCYRRLTEVVDALDQFSVVLTPHSTTPVVEGLLPDDFAFLEAGAYNLGFIALRRGAVAVRLLSWWSKRLLDWCLELKEKNLFVDQKWIDLVPAYFDEVLILRSMAYNIAYWNFHERRLQQVGDTLRVIESNEPVAFMHFSGIDIRNLEMITKNAFRSHFDLFGYKQKKQLTLKERPDLTVPFQEYAELLIQAGHSRYSALPYAYGYYKNGEKISPFERILFWTLTQRPTVQTLPFAVSAQSFYHLCRSSGIRRSRGLPQTVTDSQAREDKGTTLVFRLLTGVLYSLLRLLVWVLGPDIYMKTIWYLRHQLQPTQHRFLLRK